MTQQTSTIIYNDVARALQNIVVRCAGHLTNDRGNVLVTTKEGLVLHTRLQAIFNDRPTDPCERALHQVLITHAVKAERMGPGGFDACIATVVKSLTTDTRLDPTLSQRLATAGGRPASRADIESFVASACHATHRRVERMLWSALGLVGFGGRIMVEKSMSTTPSVELVHGHTFDLTAAFPVVGVLHEPRVALVDGFVESVAELDVFLQQCNASMEPVLLFVRGMHAEVLHTLRVNHDRGTLRIVPTTVRFDASGLNTLKDIAVVAGCDMISSTKGDLVTSLRLENCPRIESATIHANKVVIVNARTGGAVESHVADLRRRRSEQEHDALGELIDVRLRALSAGHAVVRFVDDRDFVSSSQAVDRALRTIASVLAHGLVDDHGMLQLSSPAPLGSVLGAIVHASACLQSLERLGAVVVTS